MAPTAAIGSCTLTNRVPRPANWEATAAPESAYCRPTTTSRSQQITNARVVNVSSAPLKMTYPIAKASFCLLRIGNIIAGTMASARPMTNTRRAPNMTWLACEATDVEKVRSAQNAPHDNNAQNACNRSDDEENSHDCCGLSVCPLRTCCGRVHFISPCFPSLSRQASRRRLFAI